MKVKDVYKPRLTACTPVTSLDAVGRMMWESDSGALPVVNADGKVTGMLTDRDLAMAMTAKNRGPSQIMVRELTSGALFTCGPEDDVADAIQKMRMNRIRRLPVIDAQGQLLGMLSLKDLALAANGASGISYEDVALTLRSVCTARTEALPQWPWVNAGSR
jgi:CBS domain-containing protein